MSVENRFGTGSDMIIEKFTTDEELKLIAIDTKGLYITTSEMVDKNIADVNRYGVNRDEFIGVLVELGFDPLKLYEDHKHMIDNNQDINIKGKKLNPIKASKRR